MGIAKLLSKSATGLTPRGNVALRASASAIARARDPCGLIKWIFDGARGRSLVRRSSALRPAHRRQSAAWAWRSGVPRAIPSCWARRLLRLRLRPASRRGCRPYRGDRQCERQAHAGGQAAVSVGLFFAMGHSAWSPGRGRRCRDGNAPDRAFRAVQERRRNHRPLV